MSDKHSLHEGRWAEFGGNVLSRCIPPCVLCTYLKGDLSQRNTACGLSSPGASLPELTLRGHPTRQPKQTVPQKFPEMLRIPPGAQLPWQGFGEPGHCTEIVLVVVPPRDRQWGVLHSRKFQVLTMGLMLLSCFTPSSTRSPESVTAHLWGGKD